MNLYDKDGNPIRRLMGFRGGYVPDNPASGEWVHGVSIPDRVRHEDDNWRPGGREWEPMLKRVRGKR